MKLYHGTDIFSAEEINKEGISVSVGCPFMDFGRDFYTTPRLPKLLNGDQILGRWNCNAIRRFQD